MGDKDFPIDSEMTKDERREQQELIKQLKTPVNHTRNEAWRAKLKASGITASQFLDNLTDFLCQTDPDRTTEELKAELEEDGIDVDSGLRRMATLLRKHGIEQEWMNEYGEPEATDWYEHPRAWQPDSQQIEAVDEDIVPF